MMAVKDSMHFFNIVFLLEKSLLKGRCHIGKYNRPTYNITKIIVIRKLTWCEVSSLFRFIIIILIFPVILSLISVVGW